MSTTVRPDLYTKVHRALRKALFDLSYTFGHTDFRSDEEVALLQAKAAEVIHFLIEHGHKEDTYFLAPLEAKAPGSTAHDSAEHVVIEGRIEEMKKTFMGLSNLPVAERLAAGESFYFEYNRFISDYLRHMDEEEMITTKLFYEHCTNEELEQMGAALVASIPPADMMMMLHYMVPAMDATSRIEWARGIKPNVPPPAFAGLMAVAEKTLAPEVYTKFAEEVA
jgi:hypothetical protein